MTATPERLDAITAKRDRDGCPAHEDCLRADVAYLLDLARKQAAALERVEFLAGWWQEDFPHKASLIRAALEATP